MFRLRPAPQRRLMPIALALGVAAGARFCLAQQDAPPTEGDDAPGTTAPGTATTALVFPNGDFENGLAGWTIDPKDAMSALSTEQAASGHNSLKIVDNDETQGSNVFGPVVPITGNAYLLKAKEFPVSGTGLGIYVRALDANGKVVGPGDAFQTAAPSAQAGKWAPFTLRVNTPPGTAALQVWVHSYGKARVTAYLDDFTFEPRIQATAPPFAGTYKIHPNETARLTAADVVGPDGIVYPDWRYAGVPGGIPTVPVIAKVEDFGAKADDDKDDSDAIEKGAAEVARRGGGALVLGAGIYDLDRPVLISEDGVVLRGAGMDQTHLIFRYAPPQGGVRFLHPDDGATITPSSWIEAHADPRELQALTIFVDDKQVAQTKMFAHWGATFSLRAPGAAVTAKVPDGAHTLRAVAEYLNGRQVKTEVAIQSRAAADGADPHVPSQIAAIMFAGSSHVGPELKLARDGKRGDKEITLVDASSLHPGDRIRVRAPATPRWNALVRNAAPWGDYRRYEFLVTGVAGQTVQLNQPLRLELPIIDGSFAQQIHPLRRCGVENLSVEQTHDVWTSGIVFSNAWECWARGVRVKKAGRFPLYFLPAKWCEVRDCICDDAWFKGGGGTAYVGWEYACDCLMENVQTFQLRHAPLVQWSASGNVIRNSIFHNSDAQWHSGWTNENLFENCVIESAVGNGGYGYGMWSSPPEDDAHGPNGPRNVVYNCDVSSPKSGIWLGGMNEGWLFLHNRFTVTSGPGVFLKDASFDHIFRDNVWILGDAKQPAFRLATPDCIGLEAMDNRILGGNGKISDGAAPLLVDQNNRLEPMGTAPRPQPAIASIFDWERQH